jgi:hypothetical protein
VPGLYENTCLFLELSQRIKVQISRPRITSQNSRPSSKKGIKNNKPCPNPQNIGNPLFLDVYYYYRGDMLLQCIISSSEASCDISTSHVYIRWSHDPGYDFFVAGASNAINTFSSHADTHSQSRILMKRFQAWYHDINIYMRQARTKTIATQEEQLHESSTM